MSLLPANESNLHKSLDEVLGARIESLFGVNLSIIPKFCDARYLAVIAKSLDVDISDLSEEEARAFLESAIYLKQYAGTPSVLKKALKAVFSDVEIDDQVGGCLFDVSVEAKNDISIQKLQKIKEIVNRYKNVRSKLRHFIVNLPNVSGNIYILPAASYRVSWSVNASIFEVSESQINTTGGMIWRL